MKKEITRMSSALALTITGSLVLASCSSKPPTQTTTINVEVPDVKTDAGASDKVAAKPTVEIDETEAGQAAKKQASAEPTDRDVEDPVPASKPKSSSPKPASSSRSKSQLLDFYDRLDSKHFAAFGGVNRRSLLNRKGTIVDYKRNFIEIPGSSDPGDGDLERLQITLFPNGDEPWCAVSRIVWPYGKTPGALDFYYGEADDFDRHPRTAAEGFFPYKLEKTRDGYESAFLPRKGLDIVVGIPGDAEHRGFKFHYNRDARVGEPAFTPVLESQ